jgi:ATP-dependent RNA helicase DeaD
MVRLFLTAGRGQGIRPGDLVGAITGEAGIPGSAIGAIDILDHCSFVEVPEDVADAVIAALGRTRLRGKRVRVYPARPGSGPEEPQVRDGAHRPRGTSARRERPPRGEASHAPRRAGKRRGPNT